MYNSTFVAAGSANLIEKSTLAFFQKSLCGKIYHVMVDIEFTYFPAVIYPMMCVYIVGSEQNLVPKIIETYPQCRALDCHKKGDVIRRKRKAVTLNDIGKMKKN